MSDDHRTSREPSTRIPRWTAPAPARTGGPPGLRTARLPADFTRALERTAAGLGTTLPALLMAAHARVLSTLTNERDLLVGYVPHEQAAFDGPLRLAVPDSSWADLVAGAAGATTYRGAARPEVLLDLSGRTPPQEAALPDGTVLLVAFAPDGDCGLTLRITHDTAALDVSYAERMVGYHLAALRAIVADPAGRHDRQSLLSARETETQLYEFAGPRAQLPERTFVDLFQDRVRATPDALAAVHGTHRLTYRELDERANAVAHALLRAGVRAEDVVAVVMERSLDWIAAALGVFKAGGVYLPVSPDFPADHIASQLDRSGAAFALTDAGGGVPDRTGAAAPPAHDTATATAILPVPEILAADNADSAPTHPPNTPVRPTQAAYIYFTSGSTGTPKGALCEHAGFLNHLHMKIDDMGLAGPSGPPGPPDGTGEMVAQTASQSFDISLWQFAAPLLTGAAVRIVDTEAQLGVDGFLEEIADGGVTVAQVVPSYLEVLLTHLERRPPRPLGALRALSVTGEALSLDLVRRWFALYPDIRLVNAYGATEVCDDTMHEVLYAAPERDFVPLGRSLRNVNTYILDANLDLVPLGSTGEIAFSGVCVGRGYVNDEERTRQAFVADPFRTGTRMYRTGDFGRWLPDGRIEYLGRHDEQVKIRGYRIELGEIENRLTAMPGVREAAVVIDGGGSGGVGFGDGPGDRAGPRDRTAAPRGLAAFVCGPGPLPADRVRDHLAARLPDYMVPAYVHQLERLPRTDNGKADKQALVRLAGTLGHGGAPHTAPATATEQRLAMLWAEVLGVPLERIGRADSFFELGGTSLASVRLLVHLDGTLSLARLTAHPVLADLAAAVDGARSPGGGLLQELSLVRNPRHTLVCFPYEGGNAVNYRALAAELESEGIAVLGVEPPGHDLAGAAGPLADVPELARRVRDELAARAPGPVLLWGHGAGAAPALETARLLEAAGHAVGRVFVGAQLLDDPATLRARADRAAAADDSTLLDGLRAGGAYVELDALKPERAEVVARACRHDLRAAHTHLLRLRADPDAHRVRAPLDVVVARDDPATGRSARSHLEWKAVSDHVTSHELPLGGHYFVSTRPADAAGAVRAALRAEPPGQGGTT
ncbi:non-ribosomal peptide synthetase [Streptomyces aureoverticillatus]|uniref:non-ribosomal peptide synthetase n=1 Tax=Streptomyces aureoverticillatus TaxID=66871 RepID=UPI0013DABC76|nr:amino acid adenylation domain-containing protein [Streptomyces aureoverticillatus]QIB45658.1 amino acid adenylation domain-containing protein [Streptomyces aureoverticillatus]